MQAFGRMRLDVENCLQRAGRVGGGPPGRRRRRWPTRRSGSTPASAAGQAPRHLPRTSRRGRHRGHLALGAALPRADRPRREDAGHLRVDPHGGQVGHLGAHPRPDRRRQGSGGADDPRAVAARHREVPGGELRRPARHAVRIGDLRLREGRLHRRPRAQAGPARAGQRRHVLPRRGRRPVAGGAGQDPARPRRAPLRAAGRQQVDPRRLPADLGHQSPARRSSSARVAVPRGPLLPRQRLLDPPAVAQGTGRGHPGAGGALPRPLLRRQRPAARRQAAVARGDPSGCCATTGRATSASSRARCRGRRCRRPGR